METKGQQITKSDLLLLVLFAKGFSGKVNEPIRGITRLMKLLFLVCREKEFEATFNFEPYKMGPFSSDVYPELEFLQTVPSPQQPFVKTISNGENTDSLTSPEQIKMMEDLALDDGDYPLTSSEANKDFMLSDLGVKVAEQLWNDLDQGGKDVISKIKIQYGNLPLRTLLRHVYKDYPEMTINSEIKDQLR